MTKLELEYIEDMRHEGASPREIAVKLNKPLETIRTYFKRHPLTESEKYCPTCNKRLVHVPHKRKKRFCSEACRRAWWKAHPEASKRTKTYTHTCEKCGKEFESYRSASRFCCMECYSKFRRKEEG